MTLTIDITPELETRLQQEAAKQGLATPEFVRSMLEQLMDGRDIESDAIAFEDLRAISRRSLQELWDNDEDMIYDTLDVSPASAPPELGAGGRSSALKQV
jgi:hypothetical protein